MAFIPNIPAGGEVTLRAVNELIDAANTKLRAGVSSMIQDSILGQSISPFGKLQPIWALLTAWAQDPIKAHHYEWIEVVKNFDGEWEEKEGGRHSSRYEDSDSILDPAVEINQVKGVELNTVVQLVPGRVLRDEQDEASREWTFSHTPEIQACVLTEELIAGMVGHEFRLIHGYLLSDVDERILEFYPACQGHRYANEEIFRLGIGRPESNYIPGTLGWVKWVDKAYQEMYEGKVIFRGQWQVVTLYTSLLADADFRDASGDPVEVADGETASGALWWVDPDNPSPTLVNSGYKIKVSNLTGGVVAGRVQVFYDRPTDTWQVLRGSNDQLLHGIVQTGFTNDRGHLPRTVSLKRCNWDGTGVVGAAFNAKTPPQKPNQYTSLFDDYIVSYRLEPDGTWLIVSDCWDDPFGIVKWESVDTANIRDGWRLCDGTAGAPDYSRCFIMSIDPADGAGDGSENTIGDTGGISTNTMNPAFDVIDGVNAWDPGMPLLATDSNGDTMSVNVNEFATNPENRPRYYVLAAIQRFE